MRWISWSNSRRRVLFTALLAAAILASIACLRSCRPSKLPSAVSITAGPPWIYGRRDAPFTLVEYADLECEYCRDYFVSLRQWIDANPEVNWQWHHLPLAMHDPTATQAAHLAECVGETSGNSAFWNAIAYIYQHPRGHTAALDDAQRPVLSAAVRKCLETDHVLARIRAQAAAATRDGITATPTLRLVDNRTGNTLTMQGALEGDALLSAVDRLTAPDGSPAAE